jgi:hypothetical protein
VQNDHSVHEDNVGSGSQTRQITEDVLEKWTEYIGQEGVTMLPGPEFLSIPPVAGSLGLSRPVKDYS